MNKPIILFTSLLILLLQHLTGLAQQQQPGEEALVRETLMHYIEGRNGGDSDRLQKAFHPSASLKFVQPETKGLGEWSLADYVKSLEPGKKQNCTAEITDIRVFIDAAQATVVLTYPNLRFHDYMSLLKIEGKWLIVDKAFTRKPIKESDVDGNLDDQQEKAVNRGLYIPKDARCEICTKQDYRDKSAHCPHRL